MTQRTTARDTEESPAHGPAGTADLDGPAMYLAWT